MYLDKAKAIFTNYGVRFWKWTLQKFFHFDKWHIVSLRQRKYARNIITYCNQRLTRNSFLEIGCGLGDIVRNVHFAKKSAFDIDEKVLRAASFINKISFGNSISFSVFSFPGAPLQEKFDVILMVNWIHHIEPSVLKYKIEEYFGLALNEGGVIIVDTVQDPEYEFNHDIRYLTSDLMANIEMLGRYERQREVWLIKK